MLDALRNELGLTGSKGRLRHRRLRRLLRSTLDGRLVCSCLMLAAEAEGHEIRTIEGMAQGGR